VAPQAEAQKTQEISFGFCASPKSKLYNCYSLLDQIDCQQDLDFIRGRIVMLNGCSFGLM
jgi:hypothetical protein